MSKLVLSSLRKEAYKWISVPLIVVAVVGIILTIFKSIAEGSGFWLGGLIWAVATFCFAYRLFANVSPQAAKQIVTAFYWGELFKLILSGALFVAVVKFIPISALAVFWGYVVAQLMFWSVPLVSMTRYK